MPQDEMVSAVQQDKRTVAPADRSGSASNKDPEGDPPLQSLQEQLAESRAQIDKLSKELQAKETVIAENDTAIAEKDTTIAEKDTVIAEKDELLAQLRRQLNLPTERADEDQDRGKPATDVGEYEGIPHVYGDVEAASEDTYVDVEVEYADYSDVVIDSERGDAHATEDKDVNVENVLATSIYGELFPVRPLSVQPRIAGSFPIMSDFTKPFKLLGQGAYGYAFGSELGDMPVVVKVSKTRSSEANAIDYHEWSVSERLNSHPNVLQVVGLCPSISLPWYPQAGTTGIVLPLQENGTLGSFIKSGLDNTDEWQLANLAFGMVEGIRSLHEQGAIHRDIALRNFLVNRDGRVVLCDFGLTRFLSAGSTQLENLPKNEKHPWRWMAPESLMNGVFTTKSDIWMFGQALIEILTGSHPWKDMDTPKTLMETLDQNQGARCPQSHLLVANRAQVGLYCDLCQQEPTASDTLMQSCRQCDYDVCASCFKLKSSLAPTLPDVPSIIAEIIRDCLSFAPHMRPTATEISARLWRWQFKQDLEHTGSSGKGLTQLQHAVESDNFAEVEALLGTNRVAVNARNEMGHTALMLAKSPEVLCALLDYVPLRNEVNLPVELRHFSHNVVPIDPRTGDSFITVAIENNILNPVLALRECKRDDVVSLINVRNKAGETALHISAAAGSKPDSGAYAVVPDLVAIDGIELNAPDGFGSTPLHTAVKCDNIKAVQVLLSQTDTNVLAVDNEERAPLHIASAMGSIASLRALLADVRVDVNLVGGSGHTALHYAVTGEHAEAAAVLLSSPNIKVNTQPSHGRTALHQAALTGNPEIALLLLAAPAVELNIQDNEGLSALHIAAMQGHSQIVTELLLSSDIKVNIQDNEGLSALHMAAMQGHSQVVAELLLSPYIEANVQDSEFDTALHKAAKEGHIEIVTKLLSFPKIGVSIQNDEGWTALHYAAALGYSEVAAVLLAAPKIELNAQDNQGFAPLFLAALRGHSEVVTTLLLSPNINVNIQESNGISSLHMAAGQGHSEIVAELLLSPDIEANIQDIVFETALHKAVSSGHTEVATELLSSSKVDVNFRADDGNTALFLAALEGVSEVAAALLAHRSIDVNIQNSNGQTALHAAACEGNTEVAAELLSSPQVKVNIADGNGDTPLHNAAFGGHVGIVTKLVSSPQVDVNAQGKHGATALHLAALQGHIEVTTELLSFPEIKVNTQTNIGSTALHVAASGGHTDIVAALVACDEVDVSTKNEKGHTALQIATQLDNIETAALLLERSGPSEK